MSEQTFLQRFSNVQSELKAPKSRTNKFGGYKYRSCEDILKAAKPLLKKYGMVLTMTDAMQEIGGRVYVVSTAVISDAEGLHTIQTSACARDHRHRIQLRPQVCTERAVLSGRCDGRGFR